MPKGRKEGAPPKVAQAIDKRSLLNPGQVAQLLSWISQRPRRGPLYAAFFATLYYAGVRQEEAVALHVSDAALPDGGWGEFLVHRAQPEIGKQWTDSGDVHEERELKGRAAGETRPVPVHPALVGLLREVIDVQPWTWRHPLPRGRWWDAGRFGVPPAQVAEWAGNSVPVLLSTYARCLVGQRDVLLKGVEGAQALPGVGTVPAAQGALSLPVGDRYGSSEHPRSRGTYMGQPAGYSRFQSPSAGPRRSAPRVPPERPRRREDHD